MSASIRPERRLSLPKEKKRRESAGVATSDTSSRSVRSECRSAKPKNTRRATPLHYKCGLPPQCRRSPSPRASRVPGFLGRGNAPRNFYCSNW
jgi:hypothetical protein